MALCQCGGFVCRDCSGAITLVAIVGISFALLNNHLKDETKLMLELLRLMFPYMFWFVWQPYSSAWPARGGTFCAGVGRHAAERRDDLQRAFSRAQDGPRAGTTVVGLAIGVVVAGLAQAVFQLPTLQREGYNYQWVSPWRDATVHEVIAKMLPGSIGVAAFQINVLITQCFSYWFEPTIVATFNYSVRLMELPQGMFGISLATYLLPTLSGLAAERS